MAKTSATWDIICQLAAQLGAITIANGYLTNVGKHVWTNDNQRPSEEVLGLMIYSENITGSGVDLERPAKPVRDFTLLIEAAIGTDLDDAQQQIHYVIEDIETCMKAYGKAQALTPPYQRVAMHVGDIAILDRPEGAAVIAMQVRIATRFMR